jgi:hypothetical protein
MSDTVNLSFRLCLPKIPFSGFHLCNIVTLSSKLATVSIRQGQLSNAHCRTGEFVKLSEIAAKYQLNEDAVLNILQNSKHSGWLRFRKTFWQLFALRARKRCKRLEWSK